MAYEQSQGAIDSVVAEVHGLNSKVQVIAQRMKIIERNEEIIGKTLIGHNKMLKELEDELTALKAGGTAATDAESLDQGALKEIKDIAKEAKRQIDSSKKDIDLIKSELAEIKYVLDAINPVAYATIDQVADLVEDKIDSYMKRRKI